MGPETRRRPTQAWRTNLILDALLAVSVLAAAGASFFVSASAGLGGSLILVPAFSLLLGTKEGVALAALLLAGNNVVKMVAYRRVLPVRGAALIVVLTAVGTYIGARLLVAAPESIVTGAVVASFGVALIWERSNFALRHTVMAPGLALASGATSGFSGTSGPLKGVSIRSLGLDRLHTVGAAAMVSLVGDATKVAVFTEARLLGASSFVIAGLSIPVMLVATYAGRRFNNVIGERGYQRLFWAVMGGYTVRLMSALA